MFFVDAHWRVYLELLAEHSEKCGLEIVGHCLMRNHMHLVAVPKAEESLAKAVGRTHFLLHAVYQPLPQTQRAPVAGAALFLCAGQAAFLAGAEVHRARSGAGAGVPLFQQSWEDQLQTSIERVGLSWDPNQNIVSGQVRAALPSLADLDPNELERRLHDRNRSDDTFLYWEKHRRYRAAVIARLEGLYQHEYYDNAAIPGDEDFDREGDTPCYLFDLSRPKQ